MELLRQAVALRRQVVRTAGPGADILSAQRGLVDQLNSLGFLVKAGGSKEMAEAEACLREALALDVFLSMKTLSYLINLGGEAHAAVGRNEAEAFRLRLNQNLVQMGRSPETSCLICLEPLAPPADGAVGDAAEGGDSGSAGGPSDSRVRVLSCNHQFHYGCIVSWSRTGSACPICRE